MTSNNKTKNLIIINENHTSHTKLGLHNERDKEQNYKDIHILLSTVLIMSKCKYLLSTSGNVSQWIMLFRGNSNNSYQNLNRRWITN